MATKKKVTTKKTAAKKTKKNYKSFELSKETTPFLTFLITEQTIYWSILLMLILALAIWVLNIQISISTILEGIPV